jgi:hypothetical protein
MLTKSKFKLALDCPPKLYYAANKDQYADQNLHDPFLAALAEGGYQVGELAKYLFCDDPIGEEISINELDYATALRKTENKRSGGGKIVIAEAAFSFEDLFVRTDIFVEENGTIDIYEVKSKSWDQETEFLCEIKRGPGKGGYRLDKKWAPYMYDIAFQKYVVEKANPGMKVRAHIVLADKTKMVTVAGLNQFFRLTKKDKRKEVVAAPGLTRNMLGEIPLKVVKVDDVCEWINNNPVDLPMEGNWGFEQLIQFFKEKYLNNQRAWSNDVSPACKSCQFKDDKGASGMKSGFHECWSHHAKFQEQDFSNPLVLELWGGGSGPVSIVGKIMEKKKYHLNEVVLEDFVSDKWAPPEGTGLDATSRRQMQLEKTKQKDYQPWLNKEGLNELFNDLKPPYHFIDFETSAVAIPFHKGRRPYEGIAFQYSYHLMQKDGSIEHKSQYLSFEKGVFPNYDFVRALKNDLSGKEGTIFRYHNHENNYLNAIYRQLKAENTATVPDREDLLAFIREITNPGKDITDPWVSPRPMQDLYKIILEHFYSLHAKGSNSIKDILPAVIRSSDHLLTKYSQPVYGTPDMPSLNFTAPHTWIDLEQGSNPYKTLPQLFSEEEIQQFELNSSDMQELDNGGAAMMAFSYLQFTDMTEEQRLRYKDGLLRYCELDTMAMVMIWEYFGKEIGK